MGNSEKTESKTEPKVLQLDQERKRIGNYLLDPVKTEKLFTIYQGKCIGFSQRQMKPTKEKIKTIESTLVSSAVNINTIPGLRITAKRIPKTKEEIGLGKEKELKAT